MKLSETIAYGAALASLTTAGTLLVLKPAVINGKKYAKATIAQGGKTYVSTDALKAAGAQVSSTSAGLQINFVPLGGRNQVDAVEGKVEEWLQNGQWRIRVESVSEGANPYGRGPGLTAKIEFRNLSTRPVSPFASGMDKLQIIDSNQAVLSFGQSTFKSFFKDVAPGGSVIEEVQFGDPANGLATVGNPDKLMIFFRSSGGKKAKDFRVFIK